MPRDMMCGMKVEEDALSAEGPGGQRFYFCCPACKAYFEKCLALSKALRNNPRALKRFLEENRCWLAGGFTCARHRKETARTSKLL